MVMVQEEIILPEIAYAALIEMLLDSGYPVISALVMAKGINMRDIVKPLVVRGDGDEYDM